MKELLTNIHNHTIYSDGNKNHQDVIQDAIASGLDVLIFTDHNIFVKGIEDYYKKNNREILVLMGEEIHDTNVNPQKNHLLSLGTSKELSPFANDRRQLVSKIHENQGVAFLAHPFDPPLPQFNEPDISWEDWELQNFDGIELWNGFSEFKVRSKKWFHSYFYAFFPKFLPFSPPKQTIEIWDNLHSQGKIISAIAGSDAHAIPYSAGPFHKEIFPYRYHFSTINNHVLIFNGLEGKLEEDKKKVISALKKGQNFLANDLIKPATGFRFYLEDSKGNIMEMGDIIEFKNDLSAHIIVPHNSEIRLIKDGNCIRQKQNEKFLNFNILSPGVYRVECFLRSRSKKRGWIYSNPIYVSQKTNP